MQHHVHTETPVRSDQGCTSAGVLRRGTGIGVYAAGLRLPQLHRHDRTAGPGLASPVNSLILLCYTLAARQGEAAGTCGAVAV